MNIGFKNKVPKKWSLITKDQIGSVYFFFNSIIINDTYVVGGNGIITIYTVIINVVVFILAVKQLKSGKPAIARTFDGFVCFVIFKRINPPFNIKLETSSLYKD